MYICRNYRPNEHSIPMPGACRPHPGQVIADLYDEGGFYRSAVVADVGTRHDSLAAAKQYCHKANDL